MNRYHLFLPLFCYTLVSMNSAANAAPPVPDPQVETASAGPHFVLQKVTFSTSAFLKLEETQVIVAPYIGKSVGLSDIKAIIAAVNALYQARGISTGFAVLSRQTIAAGEVHIDLIESKLGQAQVSSLYTNPSFVQSQLALKSGEVIDIPKLDQDIAWFNRTHDIQLSSVIKPGSDPGLSDLDIHADEPARYTARLYADNESAPSLGRNEIGIDARVNGLIGRDDYLSMLVSHSQGATNKDLGFGMPFNARGGMFVADYSENNIVIVSGSYSAINITGLTKRDAVSANQPWYATPDLLVASLFTFAKSTSTNFSAGKKISDFDIDTYSSNLSLDKRATDYQWSGQLAADYARSEDESSKETDYIVYSTTASASYTLSEKIYATFHGGAQHSVAPLLPPSALFQIGGPATVRGYDVGIATGDNGYYNDVELHRALQAGLDGYIFADHGVVFSPGTSRTVIAGIGTGVTWVSGKTTTKLFYGHPMDTIKSDQSRYRVDLHMERTF